MPQNDNSKGQKSYLEVAVWQRKNLNPETLETTSEDESLGAQSPLTTSKGKTRIQNVAPLNYIPGPSSKWHQFRRNIRTQKGAAQ